MEQKASVTVQSSVWLPGGLSVDQKRSKPCAASYPGIV